MQTEKESGLMEIQLLTEDLNRLNQRQKELESKEHEFLTDEEAAEAQELPGKREQIILRLAKLQNHENK